MSGRTGFPVVVAAPSGTGKTTVCRAVVDRDDEVVFSVSHTTRPRRRTERDGVDYHFVDEESFRGLVARGAFLEWAEYNGNLYGTSWRGIDDPLEGGHDVLLEIEVQGAGQVKTRRPDARFVFLLPPSLDALRARLEGRGTDDPEAVSRRLELARRELDAIHGFHYAVVNDDLETCVRTVLDVLVAERRGDVAELRERLAPSAALARIGVA